MAQKAKARTEYERTFGGGNITAGLNMTPRKPIPKERSSSKNEVVLYTTPRGKQQEITPALQLVEAKPYTKLDHLEDRLNQQERTTQALLDRAYKVKEDIIENLNYTHGTWQEEKHNRELLQAHIRSITDVVRKIGTDIQVLEETMRHKDGVAQGTDHAVKNLEVNQVAGITDLRGRVVRCDASITRLSADLKTCYDSIKNVSLQQQDANNKLLERMQHMDAKINDLASAMNKSSADHLLRLQHVEGDSTHQVTTLDSRMKTLLQELKNGINTAVVVEKNEREKLEARMLSALDKSNQNRDQIMDKQGQYFDGQVNNLNKKINSVQDQIIKDKDKLISSQDSFERKMNEIIAGNSRKNTDDIQRLKRECREGFSTVHESISNMKQVLDGKRKLLEEQIRKEIGQIRKMVVLI